MKGLRTTGKWRFWIIALILILFCIAYWMKGLLGINFFSSISLSSYFPFNYFINDVLDVKKPGTILYDDFDRLRIFSQWSDYLLRNDSSVSYQLTQGGFGGSPRCLQISSDRDRRWAYPFAKFISAAKGDLFQMEGYLHLEQGSAIGRLSIAAFDAQKKPINWSLVSKGVVKNGNWIKAEKKFRISDDNIRYISFRLTGGRGVYRFDNIFLSKLTWTKSDH
jgi:hypothetical protein